MRKTAVLLASMAFAVLLASGVALLSATPGAQAAPNYLYPNLKTLKPTELQDFGTARINGTRHNVLRFTNTVWNSGQGPLELRGKTVTTSTGEKKTKVFQRIYDGSGDYTSKAVGVFVYHRSHNHFHFGDFAEYKLRRLSSAGNNEPVIRIEGAKTTFCVMDTLMQANLPGSPDFPVYNWCGEKRQGLSVGWADAYGWQLPGQFIDLGRARSGTPPLPDGKYLLRSVADPENRIYESPNRRNELRESRVKNSAKIYFTVEGGTISR